MTREHAIELARQCLAERVPAGVVNPEPWHLVDRDSFDETGLAPAWIVHFEYILPEGVAIQCPSSLLVRIEMQTAKITLLEGM